MKACVLAVVGTATFLTAVQAQEVMHREVREFRSSDVKGGGVMMTTSDGPISLQVVKGAPFSANVVNESVQTLADGNRITHKNTGAFYRDSEGRTRREDTIQAIGPWSSNGQSLKNIVIQDPVAGTGYILNSDQKTAVKMATIAPDMAAKLGTEAHTMAMAVVPPPPPPPPPGVPGASAKQMAERHATASGTMTASGAFGYSYSVGEPGTFHVMLSSGNEGDTKTENLGSQVIEGVQCDGTRMTTVIPAGAIGNDQPIQIVRERWYSPELQTVVKSTNKDPRIGETTYMLQSINRGEPAATLFQVPSDYTVNDSPKNMMYIKTGPKSNQN